LSQRALVLPSVDAHEAPTAAEASKPVPKEQLLVPPANAGHYVVVSDAGKHGDMWRWTLPDGRIAYRHSQSLRGWISEVDQTVTVGPDGLPVKHRGPRDHSQAAMPPRLSRSPATARLEKHCRFRRGRGSHRLLSSPPGEFRSPTNR
jgi:hypothetical protein